MRRKFADRPSGQAVDTATRGTAEDRGGQGLHRDEGRDKQQEAIDRKNKARIAQMEADKKAAAKVKKTKISEKIKTGIETVKDVGKKVKPTLQKFLYGQEAAPGVVKEDYKKTGQHKLRSQFDYLSDKYGEGFTKINPKTGKMSSQAQVLSDYLSGVPVERGGGLGARDPSYGGGDFDMEGLTQAELAEAEARRQDLLTKVASGMYTQNTLADIFRDQTQADIGKGLSEDQWFNFRQQLMAADPSLGNQAYKAALPFASGSALQGVMSLAPGMGPLKAIAKGVGSFAKPALDIAQPAISAIKKPFQGISDWFKFNPPAEAYTNIGTPFAAAPSVRPDIDRGGVIDAAQSVVNQGFPDVNNNSIDDRTEASMTQAAVAPSAWNQSFQVGPMLPHPITLPSVYPQTDIAASQAAGYDIPIGGGQDPNLQDWYKNLGIMQNVYS
jgi:hypothetical protein